jgi:hypothetical protein
VSEQRAQFEIVEQFWVALQSADARRVRAERRAAVRRRQLRTLALAVLLLLLLAAAALAVRGLIIGSDTPRTFKFSNSPALGAVRQGSTRMLGLRVADPAGGPPWGVRVFATSRGSGCYQVGRVVLGRLSALGINGAFGNDGAAHPLPVEPHGCGGLDAVGHLRFTAVSPVEDSSASLTPSTCAGPTATRAARLGVGNAHKYIAAARERGDTYAVRVGMRQLRRARHRLATLPRACPAAALRTLIAGAAGPLATHVSLTTKTGETLREDVAAADGGVFLFVLTGTVPPGGVEIRATYRDGRQCPLSDPTGPHRVMQPPGCALPPGFVYRNSRRAKTH